MSQLTENVPVPWDQPKTQLPSTEVGTVAQAAAVAEAMLNHETDADPLAIRSRAKAAIHHCDERNWPEAKREFAYAAICCEWRWAQDNPRGKLGGDRKSNTGVVFDPSPIPTEPDLFKNLDRLSDWCIKARPETLIRGLQDDQLRHALACVAVIGGWSDHFEQLLEQRLSA